MYGFFFKRFRGPVDGVLTMAWTVWQANRRCTLARAVSETAPRGPNSGVWAERWRERAAICLRNGDVMRLSSRAESGRGG